MPENKQPERTRRMIGALLRVPFYAVVNSIHNHLLANGIADLRPAHLVVFQNIELDGMRLTALAERAMMTKQSMGYLVDYLEEHGYVARAADPHDGRARVVRLTERGWQVQRLAFEAVSTVEADWTALLGDERMGQLIGTLQELLTAMGEDTSTDFVPRVRAFSAPPTNGAKAAPDA